MKKIVIGVNMPDITMCTDEKCPKKDSCKRFASKPNPHWQSYFVKSPRQKEECEYYMSNKKNIGTINGKINGTINEIVK